MVDSKSENGSRTYTLAEGQPSADPSSTQQIRTPHGNGGLVVLGDTQLIETLAHFARERIPERSVHAKAAGAWGEFEVTHDVSDLTDAKFLTGIGKKTKVLSRISTVAGEKGASDTVRDVRGWSTKFFTEEGNNDWVFNDLPIFLLRDPIKFPSMNRSHKRHPRTNVPDPTMFWDYHVNNEESIHALMHLFGQRGIPETLKNINGFSVHTYSLNKEDGSFVYVKWHIKPDAGTKTMPEDVAMRLAGEAPDYHVKDLFDTIERGEYPSWSVFIQVMRPEEVSNAPIDIFDNTFTWPHHLYPLRPVGRLTLNKNPNNYFEEIEQAAFSPSNMVPGVGPSADPVLQARIFSYPDAQRYRLGTNYQQLPCNRPVSNVYSPLQRDGHGSINGNYGADPDYVRSDFSKMKFSNRHQVPTHEGWNGKVVAYASQVTDADFVQPREIWHIIRDTENAEKLFLDNIVPTLLGLPQNLKNKVYALFGRVDKELQQSIEKEVVSRLEKKE